MSTNQAFNEAYTTRFSRISTQIYKVSSDLAEKVENFFDYLGIEYQPNIPYRTLLLSSGACYYLSDNKHPRSFNTNFSVNALGGRNENLCQHFLAYLEPKEKKATGLGNSSLTIQENSKYIDILNSKKLTEKQKHQKLDGVALKELPAAKDIVNNYNYLDQLVTSNTPTVAIWFNSHPILVWYLGFLSTRNYMKIAKKHLRKAYESNNLNGISTNSQTLRQIQHDNEGPNHGSLIPRRIYSFKPDAITADESTTHNAIDFATLKRAVDKKAKLHHVK